MRASISSALAAALIAALSVTAPSTPALGEDGAIAFVTLGRDGFDVARTGTEAGPTTILAGEPEDLDPAWAPGGDRLAVARTSPGNPTSDIWTFTPQGLGALRLTSDFAAVEDRHPAWSPDGRWIAWTRSVPRTGTSSIWVMDSMDGSPALPLTDPPTGTVEAAPAWSPDGSLIAFVSDRETRWPELYVMRADGTGRRRLTDTAAAEANPAWAPDGSRLAFERSWPGRPADLWTIDPRGGAPQRLTHTPDWENDPAWSPGGDRVAYVTAPGTGGDKDLFAINVDGSAPVPLAAGADAELAPAWQPAGGPDAAATRARAASRPSGPAVSAPAPPLPSRYSTGARRVMDGVSFRRIVDRRTPNRIVVLEVDPSGPATLDVGLGSGVLPGYERTTSIARRHGAIAAINGDFPVPGNGRPSHAYAEDGFLGQSSFARSESFSVLADESGIVFRKPAERITIRESDSGEAWRVTRWNAGLPAAAEVGAYSPVGAGLGIPPADACSARLVPTGGSWWTEGRSSVAREHVVDAVACRASRLSRGRGVVVAARPGSTEALLVASLSVGERVSVEWTFGWPGAADAMGGLPLLVRDGDVAVSRCGAPVCRRHPRTGVGAMGDGSVLLVVVDGRRPLSRGLTLVGFARLFRQLGATWALNLDGGGSSTMVVDDRIVNVPSDGRERPVCCSVMVLPGPDPGEAIGQRTSGSLEAGSAATGGGRLAALDPASSGGLADALARGTLEGYPDLPAGLRAALRTFRSAGRSLPRHASS